MRLQLLQAPKVKELRVPVYQAIKTFGSTLYLPNQALFGVIPLLPRTITKPPLDEVACLILPAYINSAGLRYLATIIAENFDIRTFEITAETNMDIIEPKIVEVTDPAAAWALIYKKELYPSARSLP